MPIARPVIFKKEKNLSFFRLRKAVRNRLRIIRGKVWSNNNTGKNSKSYNLYAVHTPLKYITRTIFQGSYGGRFRYYAFIFRSYSYTTTVRKGPPENS